MCVCVCVCVSCFPSQAVENGVSELCSWICVERSCTSSGATHCESCRVRTAPRFSPGRAELGARFDMISFCSGLLTTALKTPNTQQQGPVQFAPTEKLEELTVTLHMAGRCNEKQEKQCTGQLQVRSPRIFALVVLSQASTISQQ